MIEQTYTHLNESNINGRGKYNGNDIAQSE